MGIFIKRAFFLSGLALAFYCQPSARNSDIINWAWNKQYEVQLYANMEENLRRESGTIIEESYVEETKAAPPPTTVPETCPPETQPPETTCVATSEVQTEETAAPVVAQETPLYSVNGHVLSAEIQVYLYNALAVRGIGWFYPYAMLIAYQESNFNIYAENPNGLDKGLFQYRIMYVPWMDWTNPYQQIEYFSDQMVNRANAGCTVSEMISRHNTSDYGSYNQDYVNHVMSWEPLLIKIN